MSEEDKDMEIGDVSEIDPDVKAHKEETTEFEKDLEERYNALADGEVKEADPEDYSMFGNVFKGCCTHQLDDMEYPIVMVDVNNLKYIGMLDSLTDTTCILKYPLIYIERQEKATVAENGARLQVLCIKPVQALDVPETLIINQSILILLSNEDPSAVKLKEVYLDTLKEIRLSKASIHIPTASDIANLSN
jgi:hypothetical protein